MQVTISEAARRLDIAEKTVRRRVHNGDLMGTQVSTPQGFTWMVELPDEEGIGSETQADGIAPSELVEALKDTIKRQDTMITQLQGQLQTKDGQLEGKDRQIGELHVLLQQSQAALPAPREERQSWWRFWQK